MVLCERCDVGCHIHCATPPLKRIPRDDWFCEDCVGRGFDAGPCPSGAAAAAAAAAEKADEIFAKVYPGAFVDARI